MPKFKLEVDMSSEAFEDDPLYMLTQIINKTINAYMRHCENNGGEICTDKKQSLAIDNNIVGSWNIK